MRTLARAMVGVLLIAAACSSSSKSNNGGNAPLTPAVELGRADIGPAGGTVTGGAVTIQIPAGALTETKTIIISKIDPSAAQLPTGTALANDLYQLAPDDVTFAQPVTVTVAIDPAKKRADGKGAVVLFRASTGTQQWTPYGANDTSATTLVGTTTHFSDWAPTTAAETACFLNICESHPPPDEVNPDPTQKGAPPPDVNTSQVLDCMVPSADATAGVHCVGTGPNNSAPYQCSCIGSTQILNTWPLLPPDTAVTALAAQCGAQCPTTCDLQMACNPPAPNQKGGQCQSGLTPTVTCTSPDSNAWTCTCGTQSIQYTGANVAQSPDLFSMWQACGGSCSNIDQGDWVCPGTVEIPSQDGGTGCSVQTAGTCRDNHSYSYDCDPYADTQDPQDAASPPPSHTTTCHCMVDGKPTKDVQSDCENGYIACDIPKLRGM